MCAAQFQDRAGFNETVPLWPGNILDFYLGFLNWRISQLYSKKSREWEWVCVCVCVCPRVWFSSAGDELSVPTRLITVSFSALKIFGLRLFKSISIQKEKKNQPDSPHANEFRDVNRDYRSQIPFFFFSFFLFFFFFNLHGVIFTLLPSFFLTRKSREPSSLFFTKKTQTKKTKKTPQKISETETRGGNQHRKKKSTNKKKRSGPAVRGVQIAGSGPPPPPAPEREGVNRD